MTWLYVNSTCWTLKVKETHWMLVNNTHWGFGDSDFYLRSQREQTFDERRLPHVASADETHLRTHKLHFCNLLCHLSHVGIFSFKRGLFRFQWICWVNILNSTPALIGCFHFATAVPTTAKSHRTRLRLIHLPDTRPIDGGWCCQRATNTSSSDGAAKRDPRSPINTMFHSQPSSEYFCL